MIKKILPSLTRYTGGLAVFFCLVFGYLATASAAGAEEEKIVINLANHSLSYYKGTQKLRLYPVALGKASTPTPTGYYKVSEKEINPTWTDPTDGHSIPSGPANPLGYRWMGLYGNYGIHGTNRPDSIGHYVSNGCIRMFEEDAEALYDLVKIGTPVEITYNRIVVEKVADGTVVYYIYPDGYGRQKLDVSMVRQWLTGYGVNDFESDEAILEKINASDGQPTFIGKPYGVTVNGQAIEGRAVKVEGVMFVPAVDVAKALNVDLKWSPEEGMLRTKYGNAVGSDRNNRLYANADDLSTLFHVDGNVTGSNQLSLSNIKVSAPAPQVPSAPPKRPENTQPAAPATVTTVPGTLTENKPDKAETPQAGGQPDKVNPVPGTATTVTVTVPPPKRPQTENTVKSEVKDAANPKTAGIPVKEPADNIKPVVTKDAELYDPAPAVEIRREETVIIKPENKVAENETKTAGNEAKAVGNEAKAAEKETKVTEKPDESGKNQANTGKERTDTTINEQPALTESTHSDNRKTVRREQKDTLRPAPNAYRRGN